MADQLGFILLDALLVRLIFPIGGVGLALFAHERGWGLFGHLGWGSLVAGLLAFLVLDFAVWLQHLASHKIPVFWRIHRVHHADAEVDVSTALRFHPIEILLSFIWKGAVIIALGGPVEAVLVFEIVLNGAAVFNHANASLPVWLDRALRVLVVTPDMHRFIIPSCETKPTPITDSTYLFGIAYSGPTFLNPEKGMREWNLALGENLLQRLTSSRSV